LSEWFKWFTHKDIHLFCFWMHQHFWTILHDSLIKRVTFRKNNFKTPTVNTLFECCSTNQVWDLELRVVYFIKPMLFYWRVMEHNQSNGGQSFITKAERKNPRYFEVIHNIRPRVTFFWILVNRSHSLFVWGVYSLSAHSWSFFSHNLPFLEFSTAFLTFTHCFHAEYASASFWESVYRGGAIGSGPLFLGNNAYLPPCPSALGGENSGVESVEEVETQLTFIMHSKCSCILLTKFPPQLNIGCRLFIVVWLAAWVSLRFSPSLRFLLWLCFERDLMLR